MGVEVGARNEEDPEQGTVGPMLIANAVHAALGVVLLALGTAMLLEIAMRTGASPWRVGIVVALVCIGGGHLRIARRHQTYRFHRATTSLAGPPPHPATTKDERKARARDYLRTLIRTGIKAPPMPGGLLGRFVQRVAPRLNLAQPPIRSHAYRQLRRSLYLALVLSGLLFAWIVAAPAVFPVMAALYFCIALAVALPGIEFGPHDPPAEGYLDIEPPLPHPALAIALVALSVLAPTGLSYLASEGIALPPEWVERLEGLVPATLAIVLPTLAGAGLFFVALSRQTRDLREFEGSKWGTTLPYALPEVTQGLVRHIYDRMPASGTLLSWRFDRREEALYAGFLAETEATLDAEEVASNLAEALAIAWNTPSSRSLLKLDGLGMALGLAGCGFAWLATDDAGFGDAALALAFAVASLACLSAAHKLWKRADFVSLVYEVDIEAVYLEHVRPHGQIHVGGLGRRKDSQLMSGNVRVRVLRMRSVQFEPGGQRHVTGLALDIGESTRLATAVDDYHAHVLCDQAPGMPLDTLLQA